MSKIFVVDDENEIRDICYQVFTKDGHEVTTLPNGTAALGLLASHKPDLVLMDLHMPGEEGLSLLKRFPQEKGKRIPVAIFSAYVTQEIEKQAFLAGAIDVIPKTIEIPELRQRVHKLLEAKHRVFGEVEKDSKKNKILVVDDEDVVRNFLKSFFEERGYATVTASSGEEAIVLVEKERPSAILLDVTMPGMDGIVTLKKIREINPTVGVVMATSIQDEQTTKQASELGAHAYVLKPFDMQYLQLVVLTRLMAAS